MSQILNNTFFHYFKNNSAIRFETPHKFWARLIDNETKHQLMTVERFCSDPDQQFIGDFNDRDLPEVGSLVLAPVKDNHFARAVVECLTSSKTGAFASVRYVDYGGREREPVTRLKRFLRPHEIALLPGLAFQATMTGIEPSKRLVNQDWSDEAKQLMNSYIQNDCDWFIKAKVFSVVNSVVSVELIAVSENFFALHKI